MGQTAESSSDNDTGRYVKLEHSEGDEEKTEGERERERERGGKRADKEWESLAKHDRFSIMWTPCGRDGGSSQSHNKAAHAESLRFSLPPTVTNSSVTQRSAFYEHWGIYSVNVKWAQLPVGWCVKGFFFFNLGSSWSDLWRVNNMSMCLRSSQIAHLAREQTSHAFSTDLLSCCRGYLHNVAAEDLQIAGLTREKQSRVLAEVTSIIFNLTICALDNFAGGHR